jgi:hypothetical protein
MYGGTMRSGHTSRELWSLDLNTLMWERVETNQVLTNPGVITRSSPLGTKYGP